MIGGWKSYGSGILTSIPALHAKPLVHFLRLMDSSFGTVFISATGWIFWLWYLYSSPPSLSFSSFFFYDMYTCVRLSLLPSLFVSQIYFFVLWLVFTFLFVPFRLLHCLALAMLSVKSNFRWWVICRPLSALFFVIQTYFLSSPPCFQNLLPQIWWIIHARLGPSLSHKYP